MAFVIQLLVAGVMLLAWVWLLSRPALTSTALDDTSGSEEAPGDVEFWGNESAWRRWTTKAGVLLARWWNPTVEGRRRQLMLATLIAAFVSFFLAIALKGRFVYLFLMMATLLIAHLFFATRIGARIVEERRTRAVLAADGRFRASSRVDDIQLGRTGVVTLLGPENEPETVGVTSYVSDLISEAWDGRVETSSRPASPAKPAAETSASTGDLASQLEWAEDVTAPPTPAVNVDATESRSGREQPPKTAENEKRSRPKTRRSDGTSSTSQGFPLSEASEAIFTRAAKDTPPSVRVRRKPQPIHIESALDDGAEGGAAQPRAVNQN